MTTARSPLVRLATGKIAELPSGDSILGAPGGPAATVAVGTTTTGAAGSPASVSNVGSSSAAVLDFTIPQGVAGTNGTNGTNGANGTGAGANFICNGRLTLTSGTPVTTSDVIGATTIYFTPYTGNQISTYDSSVWTGHTFVEVSIALGTLTSGKNYDVFGYYNGTALALEFSAPWTNDTTRADALALQDGVYVKSADHSRRYLGTFRTTSATTTQDSAGGVTTNVGGKRFVWNQCNRLARPLSVFDSTVSWTYSNTTTWRQANGASGNKIEFVQGIVEEPADVTLVASLTAGGTGAGNSQSGIGLDSTTAPGLLIASTYGGSLNTQTVRRRDFVSAPGYHYYAWLERATQSGTTTWYGTGGANPFQSGLIATVNG